MSKKIMFSDRYGLTQAVLDGSKVQTRRFIRKFKPPYEKGETVAIAQSYADVFHKVKSPATVTTGELRCAELISDLTHKAGWNNKMFVNAIMMPHWIKIVNLRVQPLQEITAKDCIREGIVEHIPGAVYSFSSFIGGRHALYRFKSAREAYAALINRLSGKGTWERNPYVWVYDFRLIY